MTITLNRFSTQDTTYISKHNTNAATVETAINALQAVVDTGSPIGGGSGTAVMDDVWPQSGLIGISSFILTSSDSALLCATSGAAWFLQQTKRAKTTTANNLTFTGKSSGVYAIILDTNATLMISTASAALIGGQQQLFTVVYHAGSTGFGSITRLAPILFGGDDYDRMLSGALLGSHTRVADRLSSLEGATLLDQMYAQRTLSGLTWDFKAGQVRNNNTIFSAASGTVTLGTSARHFIEVDPTTGTVSHNLSGYTSGFIALRFIQTSGSVSISNTDARTWAVLGGSGGGALTLSGTTATSWALNIGMSAAATPVSHATYEVRRGSGATVALRWNETDDQWEFTNDGTAYIAMRGIQNFNLGAGMTSRLTMIASAPQVLNQTQRSTTSASVYESLDLSSYVSTATIAVLLRVRVFDSNPAAVSALGSAPGIRFYRDSATITGDIAAKVWAVSAGFPQPMSLVVHVSGTSCVFAVDASSNNSADVAAVLQGYWDSVGGVGTLLTSATVTSLAASVGPNTYALSFGQFSGGMNRGLVTYLETSGNFGAASLYDVEFYASHGAVASQLLMQALGIDASATYTTRLPFAVRDYASALNVYLRVSHAGATSGLFSLHWQGERWA